MLIDSHCHLDFPDFDGQHGDLVTRARVAGCTDGSWLTTRDTVFSETPARSATSLMVAGKRVPSSGARRRPVVVGMAGPGGD